MNMYIYIYIYVFVYIYIYIYVGAPDDAAVGAAGLQGGRPVTRLD